MSKHFKTPWSLQNSPGHENDENFIPFVTRSKTVSRYKAEAETTPQSSAVVGDWACAINLRHPLSLAGPHWMEVYQEAPPRLLSSQAAQRRNSKHDLRTSVTELERLPSPRELYGKRRGRRRAAGERRVMAVICHLEELKKRQTGIDQLKALNWGISRSQCLRRDTEEQERIDGGQQPTDSPRIVDFTNNTDLEDRELFFQPRWNVGVQGQCPTPQDTPYLAYYKTEAEENHQPFRFLTEPVQQSSSFWEVKHCAEE